MASPMDPKGRPLGKRKYHRIGGCPIFRKSPLLQKDEDKKIVIVNTGPLEAKDGDVFGVHAITTQCDMWGVAYVPEEYSRLFTEQGDAIFATFEEAREDALRFMMPFAATLPIRALAAKYLQISAEETTDPKVLKKFLDYVEKEGIMQKMIDKMHRALLYDPEFEATTEIKKKILGKPKKENTPKP